MVLFEPFKIKVVETLPFSNPEERARSIEQASYNVFHLRSDQITIDLLTDSGTGAMSQLQWAEMIKGDEAYAGSSSFLALEETAKDLMGFDFVFPVHQGRAAEHLLFSVLLEGGEYILSNGLFDTTAANVEDCGAFPRNIPCAEAEDPFLIAPFKGNIDLKKLEDLLQSEGSRIPCIVMTITNNSHGGQPVSLANLQDVRALANRYQKLLVLDGCRFAENAYFIKLREQGYQSWSVRDISRACFDLADALTFSGKKDALSNIGGLLCLRDKALAGQICNLMVMHEGFPTYGGLAGYSLGAMNQGLKEVIDEHYLSYRLRTIEWTVERLKAAGIPVLQPAGGHAVYIEASKFYPNISRYEYPGLVLTTELFIRGGIRACELGSVAFGKRDSDGNEILPALDLVRLAFPRRVYTEAHIGYVVEILIDLYRTRDTQRRGFAFKEEGAVLRHFNSTFQRSSMDN